MRLILQGAISSSVGMILGQKLFGGVAGEAKFSFATLEKLQPLHSVLETVAERVKTRLTRELRDLKDRYRGRGPEVSLCDS